MPPATTYELDGGQFAVLVIGLGMLLILLGYIAVKLRG